MQAIRRVPTVRMWLEAIALGVVYYLAASPAAQSEDARTLAAIVWPAPALAIALLWRKPWRAWPPHLLAVFAAMIAVGNLDWLPLQADTGFAALNVLQVAVCAALGRRYVAPDGNLDSVAQLMRFVVLLPLCAIALVAVLGASIAASAMHTDWWHEWRTLMVGNGLAVLVLVPALLAWYRPGAAPHAPLAGARHRYKLAGAAAAGSVAAVLAAAATLDISEEVLRVMLSLVLVSVAIYGGMRSASLAVALAAALSIALTLCNLGPYRHGGSEGVDGTWRLQVDLAGLAVLSFFTAIAVRERKQLAVRLEQARRFESLGLLAGGIAHDFNNILGAVRGYAEMAAERLDSGSPAQMPLHEVAAAAARGKDLTEQILLAARRGDRMREVIDLRDVAREAVALATPLCRPGVAIVLQLPPDALPVFAHRAQLTRAALNLVRNASQAAHAEVGVTLAGGMARSADMATGDAPPGAAVWLEVADDGAGIAAEHLDRLFEPFFSTRNGPGGTGTGLGLAIVAGVATEHDGGIGIATSAAGTRMRLVLPLTQRVANATPATPATPAAPIGQGERIMLVDDDPQMRACCEEWLAELGFEPLGYDHPALALQAMAQAPDDIVLLLTDLDMPGLRGDALAAQIRAHAPALPVILCSGDPQLAALAQAAGARALAKPFGRDTLAHAVSAALGAARSTTAHSSNALRNEL